MLLILYGFNSHAQCPSTVTISGLYSTTYTGSNSWIASSGSTSIPTGADVTLDANPSTNGYVLLDTGFETQPNAVFLAIVQNPCALLGINSNELETNFAVFPNPASNIINITGKQLIQETEILDINGRIIKTTKHNQNEANLNISSFSNGVYLLKIKSEIGVEMKRIVKK